MAAASMYFGSRKIGGYGNSHIYIERLRTTFFGENVMSGLLRCLVVALALVGEPGGADLQPELDSEVVLVIRFEATVEGEFELRRILETVSQAMSNEPGFVRASVYQDVDKSGAFLLTEVWESRALHEAHFHRINESGDWDRIRALLLLEPRLSYHRPLQQVSP